MKILYLFLVLSTVSVVAQQSDELKNLDELLVLLPAQDVERAIRLVDAHIRIYQRFPEFYLAGIDRAAVSTLDANGIQPTIIDEQPWTESYAVVSSLLSKRLSKVHPEVRVLFNIDDLEVIKGSQQVFQQLRDEGFSCVEIERKIITVKPTVPQLAATIPRAQPLNAPINTILSLVSDSTIRKYIQGMQDFETRYCLHPNRDSVFLWLRNRFLETGVTDVVFDSFQYSNTWQKNVIATIPGTRYPSIEIIVGGHFDSYSSNLNQAPGADDNATGTAAAIEMARVLKLANYQPSYTLRFIGFAAEEVGLKGSADYAQKARDRGQNIQVMLNYDMLGYRNQAQTDRDFHIVWYPGSEAFSSLHAEAARTYTTLNPIFTTSWRGNSDSWSFYQRGYSTVFCIEHDFNPYYHTPNDLLQHLDIPYTREMIQAGLATVLMLDQPPTIVRFRVLDGGDGTSLFARWDTVARSPFGVITSYRLYYGTSSVQYTDSVTVPDLFVWLTGLTKGQVYYLAVAAIDDAGNRSPLSDEVSISPSVMPRAPQNVKTINHETYIVVQWLPNIELDLAGYNVYRYSSLNPTLVRLNTSLLTSTEYTDYRVWGDRIYYYKITAVDNDGNESEFSTTASGRMIPPKVPKKPLVGPGKNYIRFVWTPNTESDLAGYNIYRSTDSASGFTRVNHTLMTQTDFTDFSVYQNTRYYYHIEAVDTTDAASEWSPRIEAQTVPMNLRTLVVNFSGRTIRRDRNLYYRDIFEGFPVSFDTLVNITDSSAVYELGNYSTVIWLHDFHPYSDIEILPYKFPTAVYAYLLGGGKMLIMNKGWLLPRANPPDWRSFLKTLFGVDSVYLSAWPVSFIGANGEAGYPHLDIDTLKPGLTNGRLRYVEYFPSVPANRVIYRFRSNPYDSLANNQPVGILPLDSSLKVIYCGFPLYYFDSLDAIALLTKVMRDFGEVLDVDEKEAASPLEFRLYQAYPNPFNQITTIRFEVRGSGFVSLKVFDVLGQEVVTLVNEVKQPGAYEVKWNAGGLASGVYFYQMTAGSFIEVKKVLLMR